jgi:hypothetical protein
VRLALPSGDGTPHYWIISNLEDTDRPHALTAVWADHEVAGAAVAPIQIKLGRLLPDFIFDELRSYATAIRGKMLNVAIIPLPLFDVQLHDGRPLDDAYTVVYNCIQHRRRKVKEAANVNEPETTTIDVLILANHAEAINGLLYISGGGWTDTHRQIQGGAVPTNHFGIGISVRIPWHETNMPHKFVLEVQNEDATVTVMRAEGAINVGRPPQLTPGDIQHAVLAINVDTVFPDQGAYRVIATIDDGKSVATWPFRVHDTRVATEPPPITRDIRM